MLTTLPFTPAARKSRPPMSRRTALLGSVIGCGMFWAWAISAIAGALR